MKSPSDQDLHSQLLDTNDTSICGLHIQKKTVACCQLAFLFIFLLLFGAAIFYLIEHPHELIRVQQARTTYRNEKNAILQLLHDATAATTTTTNTSQLYALLQKHSLGFQTSASDTDNWTFVNAIVFSFTIVTTIGYGTFTPSTPGGQIFLVIYALIGIPAAGVALAYIAERALYVFTWLSMVGQDKTLEAFQHFDADNSGALDKEEFNQAVQLLGYTLSQHQFKQLWAKVDEDQSGLVDVAEFKWAIKYMHADVTEAAGRKRRITVTLLGILGWVGIGMVVFTLTERWRLETTFYFLFVSLTTVGLGDFFPTSTVGLIFLLLFAMVSAIEHSKEQVDTEQWSH